MPHSKPPESRSRKLVLRPNVDAPLHPKAKERIPPPGCKELVPLPKHGDDYSFSGTEDVEVLDWKEEVHLDGGEIRKVRHRSRKSPSQRPLRSRRPRTYATHDYEFPDHSEDPRAERRRETYYTESGEEPNPFSPDYSQSSTAPITPAEPQYSDFGSRDCGDFSTRPPLRGNRHDWAYSYPKAHGFGQTSYHDRSSSIFDYEGPERDRSPQARRRHRKRAERWDNQGSHINSTADDQFGRGTGVPQHGDSGRSEGISETLQKEIERAIENEQANPDKHIHKLVAHQLGASSKRSGNSSRMKREYW